MVAQGVHGYRADRAFDGEQVLRDGVLVLVADGVIAGVEPGSAPAPYGCEVTYLPGTTLLPGLVDAHTHLCADGTRGTLERLPCLDSSAVDATVRDSLAAQLAGGVTAVRDLGDLDWAVVDRHVSRSTGPTVVASGPPVTSVGGHCAQLGGAVSGVDALRRAVRERAQRGADLVKLMATGGVTTRGTDVRACQFSAEEVRAVVEEAHRLGLAVTAHAHGLAGVRMCVGAGVDGIEHCTCLDEHGVSLPPDLAETIARAGIVVCPTLGYAAPGMSTLAELGATIPARLAVIGALHRAGVTIVSGVDSGIHPVKPHGFLARAVVELAGAVPATAALASATGLAARACGLGGRTGRLRPGLDADLVIVEGDPTVDITALEKIRAVVSRGCPIRPSPARQGGEQVDGKEPR